MARSSRKGFLVVLPAQRPFGARLRVAVAAGDVGTFERVPAPGAADSTLTGTAAAPCAVTVPARR